MGCDLRRHHVCQQLLTVAHQSRRSFVTGAFDAKDQGHLLVMIRAFRENCFKRSVSKKAFQEKEFQQMRAEYSLLTYPSDPFDPFNQCSLLVLI
jgi:hypothetical protein